MSSIIDTSLSNSSSEKLCLLEKAFNTWRCDITDASTFQELYFLLREIVGRREYPSGFSKEDPVRVSACSYLIDAVRILASSNESVDARVKLILEMSLYDDNWRHYLTSNETRTLLASTILNFHPTEESGLYYAAISTVEMWSEQPLKTSVRTYEEDMARRLFGETWTLLYLADLRGNGRKKYDNIIGLNVPVIFANDAAEVSNNQQVTLPYGLS